MAPARASSLACGSPLAQPWTTTVRVCRRASPSGGGDGDLHLQREPLVAPQRVAGHPLQGDGERDEPAGSEDADRAGRPASCPGGPAPNSLARVAKQVHLEPAAGAGLRDVDRPRARSRRAGASRASGSSRPGRRPVGPRRRRRIRGRPARADGDLALHFGGMHVAPEGVGARLREACSSRSSWFCRSSIGTPGHFGVSGPLVQVTPCGTEPLGLVKVTDPPAADFRARRAPVVAEPPPAASMVGPSAKLAAEKRKHAGNPDRGSDQQAAALQNRILFPTLRTQRLSRGREPICPGYGRAVGEVQIRDRPEAPRKRSPVRLIRGFQAPDIRRRGADRGRCPGRRADDDEDRDRQPGGDDGADPHRRRRRGGHRPRRGAPRRGRRGAEDDRQGVADPGDRRHPLQPHPGAEGDRRRRPLHPPQPGQHRRPREGRRGRGEGDRGGRADADRRQLRLAAQAPARARARPRRSRRWSPPRSSSSS